MKQEGYLECAGDYAKGPDGRWHKTRPPCPGTQRPATRREFEAHPKCPKCGKGMQFTDIALSREIGQVLRAMAQGR